MVSGKSYRFPVRDDKMADLLARMQALGVLEADLLETFIRCSGPGGQKVNKTSSGVCLRHVPSGVEVKCTRERSQGLNRFLARRQLVEILESGTAMAQDETRRRIEKVRKQRDRRRRRGRSSGAAAGER